jgi:hypothetical protein
MNQWTQLTCANVGAAAESDGLVVGRGNTPQTLCGKACPNATEWKVALVMDRFGTTDVFTRAGMQIIVTWSGDYHWYLQNKSIMGNKGYFSHKPGKTKVIPTDAAGNLIPDPQAADRARTTYRGPGVPGKQWAGYNDQFCGCYCVDAVDDHVTIE